MYSLKVLQHTVAYVVQYRFKVRKPAGQKKKQRDHTDHFPLYIIRLKELES